MLEEYLNVQFESSCFKTEQFLAFARKYRNAIKKSLPTGARLADFNTGHFYCYGFIKQNNKFIYFSCSDVRFFQNDWYNHILIRSAKNLFDYTGGINFYTTLPDFTRKVETLLKELTNA